MQVSRVKASCTAGPITTQSYIYYIHKCRRYRILLGKTHIWHYILKVSPVVYFGKHQSTIQSHITQRIRCTSGISNHTLCCALTQEWSITQCEQLSRKNTHNGDFMLTWISHLTYVKKLKEQHCFQVSHLLWVILYIISRFNLANNNKILASIYQ